MSGTVTFQEFRDQWLEDVRAGDPSSVELGGRFARKLITQWLDADDSSDDLVYCDGSGDGGIDIAYLDRGSGGDGEVGDDQAQVGHTWYLVQSKYGKAFQGVITLLAEGQKVIETLDGQRPRLSSLAEGLLERLNNFRSQASDKDRILLVFGTEDPLMEGEGRVLADLRAMGRQRLGGLFDVESVSIETIYPDFKADGDDVLELVDPYIVNGCQTTRTIWEVFHQRLEAGGTGASPELEDWHRRAAEGVVVTKIAKVGNQGEAQLQAITRYTNSQNAIREKDFLALTSDFRTWAKQMADRYNVFLEIQRGGWDSRLALQKQKSEIKQFKEAANAFDLLKVYGSGWLREAGMAFGKNAPFLPSGTIFKRIMSSDETDSEPFGVDDLYGAYRLMRAADGYEFGRGAKKLSRRQTRFLFYMVVLELLKDVMSRSEIPATKNGYTRAVLKLFQSDQSAAAEGLLDTAIEVIDGYLTQGTDASAFDEPALKNTFNFDLNAFLKWERLGKTEEDCPQLRMLLAVTKQAMGKRIGGQPSVRDLVKEAMA